MIRTPDTQRSKLTKRKESKLTKRKEGTAAASIVQDIIKGLNESFAKSSKDSSGISFRTECSSQGNKIKEAVDKYTGRLLLLMNSKIQVITPTGEQRETDSTWLAFAVEIPIKTHRDLLNRSAWETSLYKRLLFNIMGGFLLRSIDDLRNIKPVSFVEVTDSSESCWYKVGERFLIYSATSDSTHVVIVPTASGELDRNKGENMLSLREISTSHCVVRNLSEYSFESGYRREIKL